MNTSKAYKRRATTRYENDASKYKRILTSKAGLVVITCIITWIICTMYTPSNSTETTPKIVTQSKQKQNNDSTYLNPKAYFSYGIGNCPYINPAYPSCMSHIIYFVPHIYSLHTVYKYSTYDTSIIHISY